MVKDDLLKEALADAKAVRDTAFANAKIALEEAFAPKLQNMLNATIQNEIEGEEAVDEFGAPEEAFDSSATLDGSEEPLDEFELGSIVKELEQEALAAEANSAEPAEQPIEEQPAEENADLEEANDSTEFAKADNKKPSAKASSAQTEDPQHNIKPNHPKAKNGGHGEIYESDEDFNLNALIKELKDEYEESIEPTANEEVEELQAQLNEYREAVKILKSKLNEVNILNAKLLFTNKLFKNHSLNESQKLRAIETLDRATTIKECKLVYSTLEETYSGMKQTKSKPAKNIVESVASKQIGSTKPSEETVKTVINEGVDLAARFKKLAGITK